MKELFSYSLMASALGIIIVFLLLVLLSGLMLLIRYLSDGVKLERKPSATAKAGQSSGVAEGNGGMPEWIGAAVAVYLEAEESAMQIPRASEWLPATDERYDRWVDAGRRARKIPGARHK